ncbi:hypothetical protein AV530_019736 [Patagioenas fasciata monilis]|uniref:Uncharacterized protein n=1 Tax=Patagioenas fasciata monilis TaxID=372326 RepID=A0A1V4JT71_PATFA|nr:hypothetical protein AV530_019736 [Patagioenas fasciata monilis]
MLGLSEDGGSRLWSNLTPGPWRGGGIKLLIPMVPGVMEVPDGTDGFSGSTVNSWTGGHSSKRPSYSVTMWDGIEKFSP